MPAPEQEPPAEGKKTVRAAPATPPHLVTLVLLSGLSVASLNLFLPSLSNIAADFRVDYALASLSIAGYAAATALLQIVMGPLSDRFGRRPVILTGWRSFSSHRPAASWRATSGPFSCFA